MIYVFTIFLRYCRNNDEVMAQCFLSTVELIPAEALDLLSESVTK